MARSHPLSEPQILRIGGRKGYPYLPRCPCCDSQEVIPRASLVDETDTFAIRPQDVDMTKEGRNYKYQEYRYLSCNKCGYIWHVEPTARWSTFPDRLTSEPHDPRPARLIDETSRSPIRELQDLYRAHRFSPGRYSNATLSENITGSPILILTGAGASVPLGFPAAKDFRLPDWAKIKLDELLVGDLPKYGTLMDYIHSHGDRGIQRFVICESAKTDMEIVLDVLLRLQDLVLQEGGDNGFQKVLSDLGMACASWFLFDEIPGAGYVYPPFTTTVVHRAYLPIIESSKYFRTIRKLLEWICISILVSCGIPEENAIKKGWQILKPTIEELHSFVDGPLPIFTTNYDATIEFLFKSSNEKSTIIDGFDKKRSDNLINYYPEGNIRSQIFWFNPEVWLKCNREDIALFHLHGSSRYFIDPRSGGVFAIDCDNEELFLMHTLAWKSDLPCILGAITPATCKERYLYSPPFGIAYDYLRQILFQAHVCVIIGHSCRDDVIKLMFKQVVVENPKLYFLIVTKGEPSPHLMDVIPRDRMSCWKTGMDEKAGKWIVDTVSKLVPIGKGR